MPYLVAGRDIIVNEESTSIVALPKMIFGNKVVDGGHLILTAEETTLSSGFQRQLGRRLFDEFMDRRIY